MSVCSNRKSNERYKGAYRTICSEDATPCPWYRAFYCITCDLLRFAWSKACSMLMVKDKIDD